MYGKGMWGALALAASAVLLGGCDEIRTRLENLGLLTEAASDQVAGESRELTSEERLAAATPEERALAGVKIDEQPIVPVSLDEAMQVESYFAVGSVLVKPKEEIAEPVVDPASLETVEVPAEAAAGEPPVAGAADTAAESSEIAEAAPAPSAPDASGKTGEAPPVAASAPKLRRPFALEKVDPRVAELPRDLKALRKIEVGDLKSADIKTLREVRRAVESTGELAEEAARLEGDEIMRRAQKASRGPEKALQEAVKEAARQNGDAAESAEIMEMAEAIEAPDLPRALQVRQKLNVDAAVSARSRAQRKLAQLGLSGTVLPEESGQMRIVIGAAPTRFEPGNLKIDDIDGLRARFARQADAEKIDCDAPGVAARMKTDAVLATECVVEALRETGDYEYVEKDYVFTNQFERKPRAKTPPVAPLVLATPNDPLWSLQWHLRDNGDAKGQSRGGAGFESFWNRAKTTGSRAVTVAVVDTGVQLKHPDIAQSKNLAPGFDMVSDPVMGNDGDGRDPTPDDPGDRCDENDPLAEDSFHGTHVAGTVGIAATNNASGVAGGAWDVTIVPVRALGRCGGKLSDINDGIRWAAGVIPARDSLGNEVWNANPADIINLSIGLFEPCPASMQAAINDAVAAGAIVVAAAGNAHVNAKYYAPGGCKNVISVAAGDARGMMTPYSNYGDSVTLMAPGGDMSRDDNLDGRPDGVLSTKMSKQCYDPVTGAQLSACNYAYENGTSMAAPHVSAALALIKSKFPAALPSELRSRLLAATSPRSKLQCSGKCSQYPGAEPIEGSDGLCYRPCGNALLDMANAAIQ